MIRIKEIQQGLQHLVGWEQSVGTQPRISQSLTESESGLTFNAAHDLLTLDNIRATLPVMPAAPEWKDNVTYSKGEIVNQGGTDYISLVNENLGHQPGSDFNADYNDDFGDGYWRIYDQLSEYLRKATADGIARMANRLVEEKTINKSSKQLFERKNLFDVAGRIDNRIPTSHCLVGYEIEPLKGLGVTTQIHRIGLQMTGATGNVTVYLFHSSRKTPLATLTLRVLTQKGYQWFSQSDLFLPYMGGDMRNDGGKFYICYQQDALPYGMQGVNIRRDWSREPCGGCNTGDVNAWRSMTRYIRISPFRMPVTANWAQNPELPDIDTVAYTPTTCYGMNLDLSIGCDLSDFIISQRGIFAHPLQLQVGYDLLRFVKNNPNVNVNRNQMNAALQMDLEYMRRDVEKAYKALDLDTEKMDSACLACKGNGVKLRTC